MNRERAAPSDSLPPALGLARRDNGDVRPPPADCTLVRRPRVAAAREKQHRYQTILGQTGSQVGGEGIGRNRPRLTMPKCTVDLAVELPTDHSASSVLPDALDHRMRLRLTAEQGA